jgi:glycosyltransferase involved in cell wall biosynthesis
LRMLENPARAQAMARAGRKRVETQFSLAAKLDRTEALYARLLAGAGRG